MLLGKPWVKKVLKYLSLIEKVSIQVFEMKNIDGGVRRDFLVDKNSFWSDLWISFVCYNAEQILFWSGYNTDFLCLAAVLVQCISYIILRNSSFIWEITQNLLQLLSPKVLISQKWELIQTRKHNINLYQCLGGYKKAEGHFSRACTIGVMVLSEGK